MKSEDEYLLSEEIFEIQNNIYNMFKLGTHNSMTYLTPKCWLLYPFKWMAQCQSKDIKFQYDLGVRYFDIRVRFDKFGNPEFAHGIMTYKADVEKTLEELNGFGEEIQIRLLLEVAKKSDDTDRQIALFRKCCSDWVERFKNLKFHCGRMKYNWQVVYEFENPEPAIVQKVSSMVGTKIDDIFPFLYALFNNRKNLEQGTEKEYMLLDFIEMR